MTCTPTNRVPLSFFSSTTHIVPQRSKQSIIMCAAYSVGAQGSSSASISDPSSSLTTSPSHFSTSRADAVLKAAMALMSSVLFCRTACASENQMSWTSSREVLHPPAPHPIGSTWSSQVPKAKLTPQFSHTLFRHPRPQVRWLHGITRAIAGPWQASHSGCVLTSSFC